MKKIYVQLTTPDGTVVLGLADKDNIVDSITAAAQWIESDLQGDPDLTVEDYSIGYCWLTDEERENLPDFGG